MAARLRLQGSTVAGTILATKASRSCRYIGGVAPQLQREAVDARIMQQQQSLQWRHPTSTYICRQAAPSSTPSHDATTAADSPGNCLGLTVMDCHADIWCCAVGLVQCFGLIQTVLSTVKSVNGFSLVDGQEPEVDSQHMARATGRPALKARGAWPLWLATRTSSWAPLVPKRSRQPPLALRVYLG